MTRTTIRPGDVQTGAMEFPCGRLQVYAMVKEGADGMSKDIGSYGRKVVPLSPLSSIPPVLKFEPSIAHHHHVQGRNGVKFQDNDIRKRERKDRKRKAQEEHKYH